MKGQVSTELLVIISVVLVIFIPMMVMVYFKAGESSERIGAYQSELAVFRLAYLANSVGALGTNTSITTDVYIPAGVSEIRTRKSGNGGEMIFKVQTPAGNSEIVEVLKYPVNEATFPAATGWARFTITSEYDVVNGRASLNIESERK